MKSSQQRHLSQKSAIALDLTFAAGFVDISGYISAFQTFTAHMTGNTVHLAQSLFLKDNSKAAIAAGVLVAFVIGSLAGRFVIEAGARFKVRSIASATLCVEVGLLIAAILADTHSVSGNSQYQILILLAMAMGLQTVTITRIGSLTVHTTFVTGMVNKFCQLVSHILFDSYDLLRGRTAADGHDYHKHRRTTTRRAIFIFSIWIFYFAGAVAGTWLTRQWRLRALYAPAVLLCLAVAADQLLPLSIEEEKDQPER